MTGAHRLVCSIIRRPTTVTNESSDDPACCAVAPYLVGIDTGLYVSGGMYHVHTLTLSLSVGELEPHRPTSASSAD